MAVVKIDWPAKHTGPCRIDSLVLLAETGSPAGAFCCCDLCFMMQHIPFVNFEQD